jgi:formylglycine-generating enzyme required for sulfatase activity/DNA-binding beta-propeller fold protein YncE
MERVLHWVVPLSLISLAACGGRGAAADAAVRTDSAGIAIVENHGADRTLGWTLRRVAVLNTPDSALTAVPWGITADPLTGRIYAADWNGARVAVFDRDGAFVQELGREGDGPGEFRNPVATTLDPHGALAVWDAGRNVVSRWSSEGDLLNEQRTDIDHWGPGFALGRDRLVTVTSETAPSGLEMTQRLVAHGAAGTTTLHEVPLEMAMMKLPGISMPAPKVLAPSVVWTSHSDTVYVLNGSGYRIDVLAGERVVSSVRRAVEPIRTTEKLALASVESGLGPYSGFMRNAGLTGEQVIRAVGYIPLVSPAQSLAVDPAGRLWVSRTTDGITPSHLDLFDASGAYLGTLDGTMIPVAFLAETRLVALSIEESGEPVLALYDIDVRESTTADATEPGKPEPLGLREFRDCEACPVMVELPPGHFRMGSTPDEAIDEVPKHLHHVLEREKPQVEVEIAYPLAIGKYEMTFAEWDHCVEQGGCSYRPQDAGWGRGNRPVIHVNRADAVEYLSWLARHTGKPYRLPSEAEWEYAARGGTTTARHWGEAIGRNNAACDGCGSKWDKRRPAPAGSFAPNAFGLHDMLGNVREWTSDCWNPDLSEAPRDGSPNPGRRKYWENGECRWPMQRGGDYDTFAWALRAGYRTSWRPGRGPSGRAWSDRGDSYGFRVALPLGAE